MSNKQKLLELAARCEAGGDLMLSQDTFHTLGLCTQNEAERQEAFDEGQAVGLCIANQMHLGLETADCFGDKLTVIK